MSSLVLKNLEKHLEVLNRKLDSEDVGALGKKLSEAKAFLASNPSKRLENSLNREIESLNERIKGAEPDKQLVKIRDNVKLLVGMMSGHPNYAPRKRAARKKK